MPDLRTRLAYGIGAVAFGAKLQLLSLLLLFYNQLLGLPAGLVSFALAVSVVIDAFWDPIIGQISDQTRSRWGRRHPYLYGVAIPLTIVFALLWRPPEGWSHEAQLAWLTVFAILTRLLISVHEIPSSALMPELSRDYDTRTRLLSYRYFFGTLGATITTVLSFGVFLRSSPQYPLGQLNAAGYAPLGLAVAIVMLIAILISAIGTHREIPKLHAPPPVKGGVFAMLPKILETLLNHNFAVIACAALLYGVNYGINSGLSVYFNTYFWGLASEKLLWLSLAPLFSTIAAALLAPGFAKRWGKKHACIGLFLASIVLSNLPLAAALIDLMPAVGSTALFAILLADRLVAGALATAGFVIVTSMIADIVEESEIRTGRRSEGLLIAADTFLQKLVGGAATILPGILLALVAFPAQANLATLDPQIMRNLVMIVLPLTVLLGLGSLWVLSLYRIDRLAHEANLAKLAV